MRGNELLDKMELIDPAYVEAADTVPKKRKIVWVKWGAIAACIALMIGVGIRFLPQDDSENFSELPMLSVAEDMDSESLLSGWEWGSEGYLAYDISELVNANPWNEDLELSTLPVYKNTLTYDTLTQTRAGANFEEMQKVLLETAAKLGVDAEWMTVVEDKPYEEIEHKIGEESKRCFEPIFLIVEADGIEIRVGKTLHASISFEPAISLPEEYHFAHDSSYDELAAVAEYLKTEYKNIIDMDNPQINIYGGSYNLKGEQRYNLEFFDASETEVEQIINYWFNAVSFYGDDEGELHLAGIERSDFILSEKVGDYPIITSKQASELLADGNYLTSAYYEMPGLEYVRKVELIYWKAEKEEYYMPYYRFYVELPEEEPENGLKTYGTYYVPAVEETYISNMPGR